MDMDLQGFLATRRRADGLVTTDAGRDLTDKELRHIVVGVWLTAILA